MTVNLSVRIQLLLVRYCHGMAQKIGVAWTGERVPDIGCFDNVRWRKGVSGSLQAEVD